MLCISPAWSETAPNCHALLTVDQRARVSQAAESGLDADILTGSAADLPRTIVLIGEETPHQALNSEAGQALYVDFDRVAFAFNFAPTHFGWFARSVETVQRFLKNGLFYLKIAPISSPTDRHPRVILDVPPNPENNPYLSPLGRSRYALLDHHALPEFLRQSLRWQAESYEDSIPNKLVNLAANGSRAEILARRLVGLNIGLLGSLTILPSVLAPDYLVPAIATLGVAWSYQLLGHVLAKTRFRWSAFFSRAYPWLDPRPRFDAKSTVASLSRIFSDHETRAVVLIVPRSDRVKALAALHQFGFSAEADMASAQNEDGAPTDRLGQALSLSAGALSFIKTHSAARALVTSLTKIIETTNETRLIWLGRALVSPPTLSTADRASVARSAYFRENPAALDDTTAPTYLAVSRAFADSLDDYEMGLLTVMIKRQTSPSTRDTSDFARLGRLKALIKIDEYRSALTNFLREIKTRPELRTTLGLGVKPLDPLEPLIERIDLGAPTAHDLKFLGEVLGSIAGASEGEVRRKLRSTIPDHVPLAAVMFIMGSFGPTATAPATPSQLNRTILNSAHRLLDPILAERPRVNTRDVIPSGPPAPLAAEDFFAPKQDLKKRIKVRGVSARSVVDPKLRISRPQPRPSVEDRGPQGQELKDRVALLRISLRTHPTARARAKDYAKMIEDRETHPDFDVVQDEINSYYESWVVKFYDMTKIGILAQHVSALAGPSDLNDQVLAMGRALELCRPDVLRPGCAKIIHDAMLMVDPLLARSRLASSQRRILGMARGLSLLDDSTKEKFVTTMFTKVYANFNSIRDKRKRLNRNLAFFTKIELSMISSIVMDIVGEQPRIISFPSKIGLQHKTQGTLLLFDLVDPYFTVRRASAKRDRLYYRYRKVNGRLVLISSIPVGVKQTPDFLTETHFTY